jgi:predicted TIM-barrel fold metal-dependent hydrolase
MNDESSGIQRLSIVDAHVHLFDGNANTHPFLDQKDETYEALVPGYLALPKNYLANAYLEDTRLARWRVLFGTNTSPMTP